MGGGWDTNTFGVSVNQPDIILMVIQSNLSLTNTDFNTAFQYSVSVNVFISLSIKPFRNATDLDSNGLKSVT